MTAATVRRLGPGDEELVRRLSAEDARFEEAGAEPRPRRPHTRESARAFLGDDANVLLAAFADGEPVGLLLAHDLGRRHGDGRTMFLYEIGVRDDRRRTGIGRLLVEELRAICRERRIDRAFVVTNDRNAAAMAFYDALGATRRAGDDVVLSFDWCRASEETPPAV